jgi:hypothetical protein
MNNKPLQVLQMHLLTVRRTTSEVQCPTKEVTAFAALYQLVQSNRATTIEKAAQALGKKKYSNGNSFFKANFFDHNNK